MRPGDESRELEGMRNWRRVLIAIVLLALTWQGWIWYGQWKYNIRLTFPDGSEAAFARVTIWMPGWSLPMNYQGSTGLFGGGSIWPPTADKEGIYRLSRKRVNSAGGLDISASAWKDGREYAAWVDLESAKDAWWPVRLTLNPTR